MAGLSVPGLGPVVAEKLLHFFDGLAAGLGVSGYRIRMKIVRQWKLRTYVKKTWRAAPTQRTPKTMNSFHVMLANPGGTKRPSAKLKSQLPVAAIL